MPTAARRAYEAIRQCRTAALDGYVARCEKGHLVGVFYSSRRHRSCPRCGGVSGGGGSSGARGRFWAVGITTSSRGEWVSSRRRWFLPATPLVQLFSGNVIYALRGAARRGKLRLPEG